MEDIDQVTVATDALSASPVGSVGDLKETLYGIFLAESRLPKRFARM